MPDAESIPRGAGARQALSRLAVISETRLAAGNLFGRRQGVKRNFARFAVSQMALVVVAATSISSSADVRYTIVDIGTLRGEPRSSDAWSINESGVVAGISRSSNGERHALC